MHTQQPDKIGRANHRHASPAGAEPQPCSPVAVAELGRRPATHPMRYLFAILLIDACVCWGSDEQGTVERFKMRATVQDAIELQQFTGTVVQANLDPQFALSLRIESVTPPLTNFANGSIVTFGIHSLIGLFEQKPPKGKEKETGWGHVTFVLPKGKTLDFVLLRETHAGKKRFVGLEVERKDGQQDYGRAIAAVNRQIEKINEEPKVIKNDQRVVRLEYSAQDGRVICFDKTGKAFLTLERRESGRFEGVFTTPAISFVVVKGHGAPASMLCPICIEEKDLP